MGVKRLGKGKKGKGGGYHPRDRLYQDMKRAIEVLGGDIILYEREGHLWLSYFEVKKGRRGYGLGTMVMGLVVMYADRRGMKLGLKAKSFGTGECLGDEDLVRFYHKFGFYSYRGDMWRRPLCGGGPISIIRYE